MPNLPSDWLLRDRETSLSLPLNQSLRIMAAAPKEIMSFEHIRAECQTTQKYFECFLCSGRENFGRFLEAHQEGTSVFCCADCCVTIVRESDQPFWTPEERVQFIKQQQYASQTQATGNAGNNDPTTAEKGARPTPQSACRLSPAAPQPSANPRVNRPTTRGTTNAGARQP